MNDVLMADRIRDLADLDTTIPDYVQRFEDGLAAIGPLSDWQDAAQLIALFDDQNPSDEAMFSLVHLIETLDDRSYAQALISGMADFVRKAPRWASIVVMRVLNSAESAAMFAQACRSADDGTREALKWLLNSINKRGEEFTAKTAPVLAHL